LGGEGTACWVEAVHGFHGQRGVADVDHLGVLVGLVDDLGAGAVEDDLAGGGGGDPVGTAHGQEGAAELAALSGRHEQLVGRTVDELEALGYVTRSPDPSDRRAKLVVPTPRGRAVMRLSDQIMADIGARGAQAVGADAYGQFRRTLQRLIDELRHERPPRPDRRPASPTPGT
jgi:DNA-binding MarR family transcriptional regulator